MSVCHECGGPHSSLPEFGGHWDTCPNRSQGEPYEPPSSENAYTGIPISEAIRSEQSEPADGPAFIAIMPPAPETSRRWYSMYCRACGVEEMMAETGDDPRLIAHRDDHNRERHARTQKEPSDAQVEAAWRTYEDIPPETFVMGPAIGKARERMRAALRAAAEVGRSLAAFQQISETQERLSAAVSQSRWPCGCRYSLYELTHPDEGHVDGDHRPGGA